MLSLIRHQTQPGDFAASPAAWPLESQIPREPDKFTLILFAHPHCPCTRATLEELTRLMTACPGPVAAYVLFVKPVGSPEDWGHTDQRRTAESIPGVHVVMDIGGAEAKRFGAKISGHVVVFDAQGRCVFGGGITGSRGHVGDNAGRTAVLSILKGETTQVLGLPVYGCALFDATPCAVEDQPCLN